MLSKVEVNLQAQPEHNRVRIESLCRLTGKTGVEMEALTAASVAALTIYDMCKAVQKIWSLARCACWRKAAASPAILRWTNAMIKVLFFARARTGRHRCPDTRRPRHGNRRGRAPAACRARRPLGAGPEEGKLLAAVNQTLTAFDHPVASGDEVAFFPPVTGG